MQLNLPNFLFSFNLLDLIGFEAAPMLEGPNLAA